MNFEFLFQQDNDLSMHSKCSDILLEHALLENHSLQLDLGPCVHLEVFLSIGMAITHKKRNGPGR